MRSGSSLCPFFSVRLSDPSCSGFPSSSPSVLLLSASHRCSPGWRSELLRLRSVLGGSVVLAVVGLGLRAAALAVAVAARGACRSCAHRLPGHEVGLRLSLEVRLSLSQDYKTQVM